ncbi:hypothetical protein C7S20_05630 [Christiangramia fulva]|uniref:Helix-turn-helix domain-containing protein n=1 Tax=Christiangramia fulva TaxID=2126553 RepID=A0A2R3Z3H2_9FLAO|nr:helix-turn-helix domain-containing protein [Christiangramia fulva]AVR44788.1 hypothetical protein C7S20_05630 [Christiangramia fulva]
MKKSNAILIESLSRKEYHENLREIVRTIEKLGNKHQDFIDSHINLYTVEETAKIFKVSRRTLFNWGRNKILTPICIGRRVYFRKEDVKELIMRNEQK